MKTKQQQPAIRGPRMDSSMIGWRGELRLPKDMADQLKKLAEQEYRSMNMMIFLTLRKGLVAK